MKQNKWMLLVMLVGLLGIVPAWAVVHLKSSRVNTSCRRAGGSGTIKITKVKVVKTKKTTKKTTTAQPKKVKLPGPVDATSLGFGSTNKDVERLMGKPTRVVKVEKKEIWYYDHSTITLGSGKLIGWSTYDRPLPVNIGAAKPNAPAFKTGMTMEQLIAAKGTPSAVTVSGNRHLWFYGTVCYTLQNGKVVPSTVMAEERSAAEKAPAAKKGTSKANNGSQKQCWCPL